jgi:hypothetical protein
MRTAHIPQQAVIIFLILLGITFLVGNILVFSSVRAATPTPQALIVTETPVETILPTPTPIPYPESADTVGILILGILLVSVILLGLVWGNRIPRK